MNLEQIRAALKDALDKRSATQTEADELVADIEQRDGGTEADAAKVAELRSKLDELDAEIDDLDERKGQAEAAEARRQRADEMRERLGSISIQSAPAPESRTDLERFMAGETRSFEAMPERRDLTTGTTNAPVPTTIYDQLTVSVVEQSPIVSLGRRIDTTSGEPMKFPTSTPLDAATQAEATAITENDPTLGLVDVNVTKYGRLVQLSTEMITDSSINWVSEIGAQAGPAVGAAFGADLSAAVVTGAAAGATAGAVSGDLLVDLFYSVQQAYRSNGTWLCNSATAASIRKLAGSDGHGLWTNPLEAGQPATLLGRPFLTDDTITDDGTVLFGDFGRGVIVRFAGGVRFDRSDHFAFDADMATFRVLLRAGGAIVDAAAVKKLTAV